MKDTLQDLRREYNENNKEHYREVREKDRFQISKKTWYSTTSTSMFNLNELRLQALSVINSKENKYQKNYNPPYSFRRCKTVQKFSKSMNKMVLSDSHEIKKAVSLTRFTNVSNGDRLYYKALIKKETSIRTMKTVQKERDKKFKQECTFTPQLNKSTILMNLKNSYSNNGNSRTKPRITDIINSNSFNKEKVDQHSYRYLKKTSTAMSKDQSYDDNVHRVNTPKGDNNNNKFNLKQFKDSNYDKITPIRKTGVKSKDDKNFVNSIDSKTTKTTTRKKTTDELIEHSNKLYREAEALRISKEKLEKEYYSDNYPFTPNINSDEKPSINKFFYRLQRWVDKRNEKYEYDMEKNNYDDKTGLRLFSPCINKNNDVGKEYALNERNKDKFKELYNDWMRKEVKRQDIKEQENQENEILANINHINEKSKEIVKDVIRKLFFRVFEILAGGEDNILDGSNARLEALPDKIKNMVMPLIIELQEQNETLTKDEFFMACKHLYNTIPMDQKHYLMEWHFTSSKNNKDISELYSFPYKVINNFLIKFSLL